MVHHDNALGRLTEGSGALLGKTAAELKAVAFKNTPERMMTLGDLCALRVKMSGSSGNFVNRHEAIQVGRSGNIRTRISRINGGCFTA